MRLDALDGLRGLSALFVALFHFDALHSLYWAGWLRHLYPVLTFFFLVSGFVMAMTYGHQIHDLRSSAAFAVRRAGRLWPVHLFALVTLVLLELIRALLGYFGVSRSGSSAFTGHFSLFSLVENVFLIQSWALYKPFSWNGPAWTMSTELIAYLLFVTLILAVGQLQWRIAGAFLLAAVGSAGYAWETELWKNLEGISIAWCIEGFFFGYVLYYAWRRWPIRSRSLGSVVEIGAFVAWAAIVHMGGPGWTWLILLSLMAALIYAVASERGVLSQVLRARSLVWLGQISLPIYLLHIPILVALNGALRIIERTLGPLYSPNSVPNRPFVIDFGHVWMADLLTLAYFATVIGLSALTHYYIEAPSRDFFGGLARRISRRGEARG